MSPNFRPSSSTSLLAGVVDRYKKLTKSVGIKRTTKSTAFAANRIQKPPYAALSSERVVVFEVSIRLSGLINNGRRPAIAGLPILFHVPTLFRSSVAVQNDFGSTRQPNLNLVAVPHGGISPRTLSPMKVSADSRRWLQFRGSMRARAHPPTDPRSAGLPGHSSATTGLRPGGCCDSSRNAPDRKSALRCCHQSQGQCADATLVAVPCVP